MFAKLVLEPLRAMRPAEEAVVVVLDGVDELPEYRHTTPRTYTHRDTYILWT